MEDDDELGYYEDGVKRTLTDEQIAIFRHSEIHNLQEEQRKKEEAQIHDESSTAPSPGLTSPQDASDEDDEEEYARFLEQERKEFQEATAKQRKKAQKLK